MSIISPADLEASPLADLHALASALGIDGFRRLRKEDLIDAILARQWVPRFRSARSSVRAVPPPRLPPTARLEEALGGGPRWTADHDEADDGGGCPR